MVLSTSSLLALAACGGGGGGSNEPSTPPPPVNTAPTVQAGTDQTIELPVATAQLTGSATDTATSSLTYSWSATSGPAGVVFGTGTAATTSVTFPAAGSYQLTLSASDGSLSGTDVVLVTVSPAVYPASDTANSDLTNHGWTRVAAATEVGMNQAQLDAAATYAVTGGGVTQLPGSAGMIVRRGRLVHSWGSIDERFDMKSTSKSIGGVALGLAIDDNLLALTDIAQTKLATLGNQPVSNDPALLDDITVLQLATHTAGFLKEDTYNPMTQITTYAPLQYQPGSTWFYSDAGLNWLSEVLTTVFNQDLASVLSTDVWTPLGLNSSSGGTGGVAPTNIDVQWRDNRFRPNPTPGSMEKRELASGIFANVNAMARIGLLFLRKGVWANDQRILSESFVRTVSTPPPSIAAAANPDQANFPGATTNYGVLWWTNAGGQLPNVPTDAFWAWGLGDSLIVVIPSLDIVAVRAGPQSVTGTPGVRVWNDLEWNGNYAVLADFINPIVASVTP